MPASILVVEDDPDLRDIVQQILQDEGHRVFVAENGADAYVHLYFGPRPDLVVLNLWMPVVNGPDVLDVIRRDPNLASVPVIVMSGAPVPAQVRQDATFVVPKPFDVDDLLGLVAIVLGGPPGPSSTPPPVQV